MIRRGAVFRNQRPCSDDPSFAFDFFKGENISAGMIEGKPAAESINIDAVSDNSLWRFRDILPKRGYAFLQITLGLSGAPFDPSKIAFLDTATLFFPRDDLSEFPFDLALLSRVYQYYFALALRQGAVSKLWSHLYPRNLRKLPWSDQLAVQGGALEALRPRYLELCRAVHNRRAALLTALQQLGCVTWQDALRAAKASVVWPESVDQGEPLVIAPASRHAPSLAAAGSRGTANESTPLQLVQLGPSLHDFVEVSDPAAALQLAAVLSLWEGESLSRSQILRLDVPRVERLGAWRERMARYDAGGSQVELDSLLDQIDTLVGPALGLSVDDIAAIQHAMRNDPFLKHIRPNLPYSGRAQRGLSDSLASAERYVGETA